MVRTGLSRTAPRPLAVEDDVGEALAVLDAAGVERAAVLGLSQSGPAALVLAARHPERVSHVVLVGTYASGPRAFPHAAVRESMLALVRAHWGIGSKVLADMLAPGAGAEAWIADVREENA